MQAHNYIGRYAPSPSGDLHLGNLRTALLAWLHARLNDGQFLLRMEDLDTPRVVSGSGERILSDLQWLGINWDGEITYQSSRTALYQQALDKLHSMDLLYPCFCSRKDIRMAASAPHGSTGVYPGTCADLSTAQVEEKSALKSPALRLRVDDAEIGYHDTVLGPMHEVLSESCGDFVVRRADGLFAYQLAVVVDDLAQGITDVLRGADLAGSSGRQIYLAQLLAPGRKPINYLHVPLMLNSDGQRMAKRDGSQSASAWRDHGKSAEQLVHRFASQLGLVSSDQPLSASTLLGTLHGSDVAEKIRTALDDAQTPA